MIENLLQAMRRVITLSPEDESVIASLFKPKEYRKDEFFLAEGQICRQVGFVNRGLLRYYINHHGEDKTYDFAMENDFVCNYESYLPQTPSTKIIQALEDCQLLQISHQGLQAFYRSVGHGEQFGRRVIEQVFVQTLQALSSFYTDTPEDRYEKFIRERPGLQQRVSQYHIASYVGVKPQSLSRIRKRMSSQK